MALAVDAGIARDAGHVGQLVGVGLVDREGRLVVLGRKRVQDRGAQDRRVVHATVEDMVADGLIDREDAALGRPHAAAVAGEGVDVSEVDVVELELV